MGARSAPNLCLYRSRTHSYDCRYNLNPYCTYEVIICSHTQFAKDQRDIASQKTLLDETHASRRSVFHWKVKTVQRNREGRTLNGNHPQLTPDQINRLKVLGVSPRQVQAVEAMEYFPCNIHLINDDDTTKEVGLTILSSNATLPDVRKIISGPIVPQGLQWSFYIPGGEEGGGVLAQEDEDKYMYLPLWDFYQEAAPVQGVKQGCVQILVLPVNRAATV